MTPMRNGPCSLASVEAPFLFQQWNKRLAFQNAGWRFGNDDRPCVMQPADDWA